MLIRNSLINSWATAIVDIAIKEKKVNDYIEQSGAIIDLLKGNPDFVSLLSVHQSKDGIRTEIIENVFKEKDFDIYIINALKIMVISDLIFHARDIFKVVRKQLAQHNSITYGVVWSIKELDDITIKTLEDKISKKINQKVILVNKIDESLLGGIQVVVKGENFDGSIKGKLLDIKTNVLNINSIEE